MAKIDLTRDLTNSRLKLEDIVVGTLIGDQDDQGKKLIVVTKPKLTLDGVSKKEYTFMAFREGLPTSFVIYEETIVVNHENRVIEYLGHMGRLFNYDPLLEVKI